MAQLIIGKNDLLTWCKENGAFGEQLINEFKGIDEEGEPIKINEVPKLPEI